MNQEVSTENMKATKLPDAGVRSQAVGASRRTAEEKYKMALLLSKTRGEMQSPVPVASVTSLGGCLAFRPRTQPATIFSPFPEWQGRRENMMKNKGG